MNVKQVKKQIYLKVQIRQVFNEVLDQVLDQILWPVEKKTWHSVPVLTEMKKTVE